jgi:Tfp pilus assembly protein PilN
MRSASALAVDFAPRRSPAARAGVFLLACGVVAAIAVAQRYEALGRELAALESRQALVQKRARAAAPRLGTPAANEAAAEIRAANAVIGELTVPWQDLFADIESAADPAIALLAVQPDAQGRAVRVSGVARNFEALLAYMQRLEATRLLAKVYLVRHEMRSQDVEFTVHATWASAAP